MRGNNWTWANRYPALLKEGGLRCAATTGPERASSNRHTRPWPRRGTCPGYRSRWWCFPVLP